MTHFTVFGSNGFIGRHLTAALRRDGHETAALGRYDISDAPKDLGHVIYAIGMTGNYRSQPYDTIDAHVGVLSRILQSHHFSSFLYLSSTRVYRGLPKDAIASEDAPLPLKPDADSIYDYSKLLGEALSLAHAIPTVRVARLSNVYGAGMSEAAFLGALYTQLHHEGKITIQDNPQSAKDYIHINDAVKRLSHIAVNGKHRIYNVASGKSVSCHEIATALSAAGHQASFAPTPQPARIFPTIDTRRIENECGNCQHDLVADIAEIFTNRRNLA